MLHNIDNVSKLVMIIEEISTSRGSPLRPGLRRVDFCDEQGQEHQGCTKYLRPEVGPEPAGRTRWKVGVVSG